MRSTVCLAAALAAATGSAAVAAAQKATTGNGAPSGYHYNLNIIGVPHYKNPNMDQASGNVIFVMLGSTDVQATTKILLSPGEFGVLDKNGTDGTASFSLPAGGYDVYVRPLGKPGGRSQQKLCGTVTIVVIDPVTGLPVIDPVTGLPLTTTEVLCSVGHSATRTKGKQTFKDVTAALTTITLTVDIVCTTGTSGTLTTIPAGTNVGLFDPCVQDFFWNYDNYKLKLLQVRFYPT
jgi:hypothetical protein